jgi:hypothetical protein
MKGVSAVQLGNLAEVAEIVIGKLVEHLRKVNDSEFRMFARARRRVGGDRVQVENKSAPEGHKFLEILAKRLLLKFRFRKHFVLRKSRRILQHDAPGALLVQLFDHHHVLENFGNGPAVGGWLPLQGSRRKIAKKNLQNRGSFFEQGNCRLNRCGRNGLHRSPHGGTLIVSLQELDAKG